MARTSSEQYPGLPNALYEIGGFASASGWTLIAGAYGTNSAQIAGGKLLLDVQPDESAASDRGWAMAYRPFPWVTAAAILGSMDHFHDRLGRKQCFYRNADGDIEQRVWT